MFSFIRNYPTILRSVAAPLCIFTSSEFLLLHILASFLFLILAILIDVWCYLILICSYVMANDVGHLLIRLFPIWTSSFITCLFRSFVHFLIGWFFFLFEFFVYFGNQSDQIRILSNRHFANFFSGSDLSFNSLTCLSELRF